MTAEKITGYWKPLASNHTYTPNQFFDVVLPSANLSVARLVGFTLRWTIGYVDQLGNPRRQQIYFDREKVAAALNLSTKSVKTNLREAEALNFIEFVYKGHGHKSGMTAHKSIFKLKWSTKDEYITDLEKFDGFLPSPAHRTVVPNQFFDDILINYNLRVTKVIGLIIRKTIGYIDNFGNRKIQDAVSRSQFMTQMKMGRGPLEEALQAGIQQGMIKIVDPGQFIKGQRGESAVFSLFWEHDQHYLDALSSEEDTIYGKTREESVPESERNIRAGRNGGRISTEKNGGKISTEKNGGRISTGTGERSVPEPGKDQYRQNNSNTTVCKQQQETVVVNPDLLSAIRNFIPALSEKRIAELVRLRGEKRVEWELKAMEGGFRHFEDKAKFFIASITNDYSFPDNFLQQQASRERIQAEQQKDAEQQAIALERYRAAVESCRGTTERAEQIWGEIREKVKILLDYQTFDTWIRPLRALGITDHRLIVQAPNEYMASWVKKEYIQTLEKSWDQGDLRIELLSEGGMS